MPSRGRRYRLLYWQNRSGCIKTTSCRSYEYEPDWTTKRVAPKSFWELRGCFYTEAKCTDTPREVQSLEWSFSTSSACNFVTRGSTTMARKVESETLKWVTLRPWCREWNSVVHCASKLTKWRVSQSSVVWCGSAASYTDFLACNHFILIDFSNQTRRHYAK